MYLVLLRHTMDDLPVRLCDTRAEALQVAKEIAWEPSERDRRILKIDCSTPVCVSIVRFDAKGHAAKLEIVRDFENGWLLS